MSRPRWITAAGDLGSIPELFFYEKRLEVSSIGSSIVDESVTFVLQSGELPPGIQVVRSGMLQGVPVVLDPITVDETREYRFTVRATTREGVVVDRTFFLSVNNVFPPVITPRITNLGNVFDGSYFTKQLRAVEENPNAILKWKVVRGSLPPGISITDSGLISGYILKESDEYAAITPGYDNYDPNDASVRRFFDDVPYDSLGKSRNRTYSFTVEVSDGANVDSLNYSIAVASKGLFTADQEHYINGDILNWEPIATTYLRGTILKYQDVLYVATEDVTPTEDRTPDVSPSYRPYQIQKIAITADNNLLTIDHDDRYMPVIITPSGKLPTLRQDNNFAFKFDAIDFNGDDLVWSISTSDGTGFDKDATRSIGFSQDTYLEFYSNGDTDTFLLAGIPEWVAGKNYSEDEIVSHQEKIYKVVRDHLSLINLPPDISDDYSIQSLSTTSVNVYSDFPEVAEFSIFGIFQPDSDEDEDQDPDIVELESGTDYAILDLGQQIKFNDPLPQGKYFVGLTLSYPEINPENETGVGFDRDGTVFDEGESRLPPVLSLDDNGWLHGYLEPQQEEIKSYDFIITAEKKLISQRKVLAPVTAGSPVIDLSYVSGTSTISRTISLGGLDPETRIISEQIIDMGTVDMPMLVSRVTLSQPAGIDIPLGDIATLRSATADGVYRSGPVQYQLTVLGSLMDRIIWKTPENLGSIVNGAISELRVEAVSEMGQTVKYSLVSGSKNRLPQALSLNLFDDGVISGRATFRYFQLDKDATTFDRNRTRFDNTYQFDIKAETANIKKIYRSSGRRVSTERISISGETREETSYPNKIYLAYSGSSDFRLHEISGKNISPGTVVVSQIKLSDTNGSVYTELTLDRLLAGEIQEGDFVYILDGVVSSIKTFKLRLDIVHKKPFENLYFKAFPTLQQRQRFFEIINDQDIFPDELIYRLSDPWFGKATTIKFLAAAGINASDLDDYISAIDRNHYWRQINFGEIKTAVAVDEFYNTKYEVVYIDIVDPNNLAEAAVSERVELKGNPYIGNHGTIVAMSSSGARVTLREAPANDLAGAAVIGPNIPDGTKILTAAQNVITLNRSIPTITGKTNITYQFENQVIYPSTFANMNNNVINDLGYQARGVFPDWMTSVQPDRSVLGFRRAAVLAYTVPGASKLIAYRLKSKRIRFDDVEFTIDRYQLDNALSKNFVPETGEFKSSKETTFDRLTLGPGVHGGGIVNYAVEQSFDSINKRTVKYIQANGGIDGVKSFEHGDLLVFARQEQYDNVTGPFDGWIDYQNLYIGDIPNDGSDLEAVGEDSPGTDSTFGFDAYRVIPGVKNKALTVEQHLLRVNAAVGSTQIVLPWLLGVSYMNKSVAALGIAEGTQVIDQSINYENNEVTVTLNKALLQNLNSGSTITVRSTVIAVSMDQDVDPDISTRGIAVNQIPLGIANGMRLFGPGIPANTVVNDVRDNVLVTNNELAVVPGAVISYEIDNQRGGIWRININDEDLVSLEFVREVDFGEKIKVLNGVSHGFTFMVYDTNIRGGQTVPTYRQWRTDVETSGGYTVFDNNGTRFFDHRDNYQGPEADDKYLKFPQIGVFE